MSKPCLLLLPGMLNTETAWSRVTPLLRDVADIRIADFTTQDSIEAMARSAWALAEGYDKVAIAGFSMGGFVAAEMLAQQPARVGRLAFIDTSVRTESPKQAAIREKAIAAASQDFEGTIVAGGGNNLHPDHRADAVLIGLVRGMARQVGLDAFVRQSRALMQRKDYRQLLAGVTMPVSILCGKSDEMTPPRLSEEMAELVPGSRLEWIEPAAHMTLLEQPGQVAEALKRWLAR
ncbi:alpha/beta hydrolase [Verticiella sediminum]|uniref:Alpha/beta hydrolase n=1 Tax=Verticiella sediminum TaxID=1247510 RepID=A0A556B0S9_9BURK|nr:alpha/beta hydrolase [Verticiella sediminum]TSH98375.1 alpha/beta hydrolase [Verticiella sediminum]